MTTIWPTCTILTVVAKLTGLFLGAGASYEVGMRLVWELTEELFRWITPQKLRDLNQHWRAHGGGRPDEVIDDLTRVLVLPGMHYESVLGYLETQYRRHRNVSLQHEYHAMYSLRVEMPSLGRGRQGRARQWISAMARSSGS